MFDMFGEFDSAEELNNKAEELKRQGDSQGLKELAVENGLDPEDAEDYMDNAMGIFASVSQAAAGKLKIESEQLRLGGQVADWSDEIMMLCTVSGELQAAVRRKGKTLRDCISCILKYDFENMVEVNKEIVAVTKVMHGGREEQLKGPIYTGSSNKAVRKHLVYKYYGLEK